MSPSRAEVGKSTCDNGVSTTTAGAQQERHLQQRSASSKQMTMSGGETNGKKQVTPSQKRLQKQQRQQQQAKAVNQPDNTETMPQKAPAKSGDALISGVEKLTDKNECCKLKISSRLDEFSKRAGEIKSEISAALQRQTTQASEDQNTLANVETLRARLGDLVAAGEAHDGEHCESDKGEAIRQPPPPSDGPSGGAPPDESPIESHPDGPAAIGTAAISEESVKTADSAIANKQAPDGTCESAGEAQSSDSAAPQPSPPSSTTKCGFEPLSARLDPKSKLVALKASLDKQFGALALPAEVLEPICVKLIDMSRQIGQLGLANDQQQREIGKLRLVKEKLGDLCRELQRSNNQIRIESLNIIKTEQHKAKEQADKIQTTLAGVMKLFDENQQRNVGLRQENVELQTKLRQLLEHCENWEQCVETAMKQRDIENRLIKTEMTRLSLLRNEEQERFLREKQELLKAIDTMKSHQSRVEDKEAKLRSDLSSYASKYDQCQELIQNGLGKFQVESKRMLKQIEQSRQDYVNLLGKYETSNKKIKQLLEEKQAWMKSTNQANKKLEALERLCRSLKGENDRLLVENTSLGGNQKQAKDHSKSPDAPLETKLQPPVVIVTASQSQPETN